MIDNFILYNLYIQYTEHTKIDFPTNLYLHIVIMIISTDYPSVITKNTILDRDQESNAYRYNQHYSRIRRGH